MILFIILLGLYGQEVSTNTTTTSSPTIPPSKPIQLDQKEQQQLQEIQRSFNILNLQLEMLRHDVCWRSGVKVEECGQWDSKGGITRIPLPQVKEKTPEAPQVKDSKKKDGF
jgi:hypothetical protein